MIVTSNSVGYEVLLATTQPAFKTRCAGKLGCDAIVVSPVLDITVSFLFLSLILLYFYFFSLRLEKRTLGVGAIIQA